MLDKATLVLRNSERSPMKWVREERGGWGSGYGVFGMPETK